MWPFKKKKKPDGPVDLSPGRIIEIDSMEAFDKLMEKMRPDGGPKCPEVMLSTQACVCSPCKHRFECHMEKMARSTGCVQAFPIYCSLRDSELPEPKLGWATVALKSWIDELKRKFEIEGEIAPETFKYSKFKESLNDTKETSTSPAPRSRVGEYNASIA